MTSKQPKPWNTLEQTQELLLDSDYVVDLGSEFGDLSSKEEMIDAGCDPVVEREKRQNKSTILQAVPCGTDGSPNQHRSQGHEMCLFYKKHGAREWDASGHKCNVLHSCTIHRL